MRGGEQSRYVKAYDNKGKMIEEDLAAVKLFRWDPEIDSKPRYGEFRVPYKGYTVANVLSYIYENLDSSFAFRWACGKGFCRCCVVSVNGEPVLSCMEPASKNMTIEPHPKFRVIKDLVIDYNELK
jgi:succinate dehydrogenase / fumarate reductase iron-sulfur subunit